MFKSTNIHDFLVLSRTDGETNFITPSNKADYVLNIYNPSNKKNNFMT